ncbi:MAG TPA: cytochrome C [Xanthomonadales bacterium]|nr:cytochrome C [Xanthomonadales bacterium]
MSLSRSIGPALLAATALLFGALIGVPASARQDGTTVVAAEESQPAQVAELTDAHAQAAAGDPAAGQSKAVVCSACHGMDGNSADPQYPKLAGQHERYIARHLALFKSGERENAIMLGFAATLSAQDMRDIGAFYAGGTVKPGLADETVVDTGPYNGKRFYEIGQAIYRGGIAKRGIPACGACHGPTGSGNPGPSYPALAGQHARYTADMLRRYRDGAVYGHGERGNKVMSEVAQDLTDQEIDALASYIEGLYPSDSAALPR